MSRVDGSSSQSSSTSIVFDVSRRTRWAIDGLGPSRHTSPVVLVAPSAAQWSVLRARSATFEGVSACDGLKKAAYHPPNCVV